MAFDVKMIYTEYYSSGNFTSHQPVNIPTGQKGIVKTGIVNGISASPKITLTAEDNFDNIVWQKSWTGAEFGKLTHSLPINIVVSAETNSP